MIKKTYQKIFPEKWRYRFHILKRKAAALFLRGNRFYCPCCEKESQLFLKKGNGIESRENAVCPHCGSLERTRLLCLYLKNETTIFEDHPVILHFAPEESLKKKFSSNTNYVDADINPNLATYKVDITEIDFPENYFDYIICSHVLGHIKDEKKALQQLYRVLKKGGTLFLLSLMEPESDYTLESEEIITPMQKLNAYGERDLERLYGNDFKERISNKNVTVERIDYRLNFSGEERKKMNLGNGKREIIFKVVKTG